MIWHQCTETMMFGCSNRAGTGFWANSYPFTPLWNLKLKIKKHLVVNIYDFTPVYRIKIMFIWRPQNLGVAPSFPYLLNMINDSLLPYFYYLLLMFHHCSCLISGHAKLLKLNISPCKTLVVTPIQVINTPSMKWGYQLIVHCYPNSKIRVTKSCYC